MLKIRCSAIGKIMTNPKTATDKEYGLSETTKTYLRELWIEKTFGRIKNFTSDCIEKGNLNELDAIKMLLLKEEKPFRKNENLFANDFILGTPDVIYDGVVYDTKCSWDIYTFLNSELTKDNLWQMVGYLELTGNTKGKVAYCLTDTPEHLMYKEVQKIMYSLPLDQVTDEKREEVEVQVRKNHTYDDIPFEKRIRIFEVIKTGDHIEKLYDRIENCRKYYNEIEL